MEVRREKERRKAWKKIELNIGREKMWIEREKKLE